MSPKTKPSLEDHFQELSDPRDERYIRHQLLDIIIIAMCAVISGADTWVAVEAFGQAQERWLKERLGLALPHGIPSHDTFGTVFALLEPEGFQRCFMSWIEAVSEVTAGEVIAVDGKTLRGSHDRGRGQGALELVSAWANQTHLVLGQHKVAAESNEITAIPALLELLALKGCLVTLDAQGCQTHMASQIVAQEGDYLLALKENQGQLYRAVADLFAAGRQTNFQHIPYQFHQTFTKDHGRLEWRRCWTIDDPAFIAYLDPEGQWAGLTSVVLVEAERTCNGQTSVEQRYYLSSLPGEPQRLLSATRQHWGIENKLHWVLDVAFDEDHSRVRRGHAPENFARLRHLALNLLKHETTDQRGFQTKRLRAAWDAAYREQVLASLT